MRSSRTRSLIVTAAVLALGALGWIYLAPTQIGGSTHYVITHGISMEPMLHTGDLVIVRPVSDYRVGQVVAYHSTLLHTVVLHRIIGIAGGHYTFKGDNNSFIDPTHPTRSMLVGAMWLHIPHGGDVLNFIHKPWVAAALTGGVAAMLLLAGEDKRRRRRRRGQQPAPRPRTRLRGSRPVANRQLLAASAALAALFAALAIYGFIRPRTITTTTSVPYTQQVSFGYSARVHPGPAYPSGVVSTGDPLYTPLVHELRVTARYRLSSATAYRLAGHVRLRGTVANTSGWSRSFWLGPAAQITAGYALATADISLRRFDSLVARVSTQIGLGAGTYTLAVVPRLSLNGEVGGQPVSSGAQPSLSLALSGAQLLGGGAASTPSGATSSSSLVHTTSGEVTTTHASADELGPVPIKTVRLIGVAGFALLTLTALLLGSRERGATPDPAERINSRYKHLIVPVSSIATNPEHPPIEVRTIEALVQLAQRSERLILHDHHDGVDNYLIDDQGTLFRFQALRAQDTNGNGKRQSNGNLHGRDKSAEERVAVPAAVAAGSAEAVSDTQPASGEPTSGEPTSGEPTSGGSKTTAASYVDEPEVTRVAGFAPLSDPVESAEAIRLSRKVTPVVQGPQPRRPPAPNYAHWTQRPEVRIGFTLGPLLTLLALRRVRARRADGRTAELDEQSFAARDRSRTADRQPQWTAPQWEQPQWGAVDRRQPQRGPGDRRRGDRRRN